MRNSKLPKNWEWIKLDDFSTVIMGQSPPSSTYNTIGDGLPFFQGKSEFTELHPVVKKWCSIPKKISEPNDILISVRAPVGASNITNIKCCIGRGLAIVRYSDCHKYLFYFFRSIESELDKLGTGTTFRAISGVTLKNLKIPLPPLQEQKAIVAKIEELFSELDNGVESLKKVKEQIKTYKQSVLKAAFEGKLTGEKISKDSELPDGWKWLKVGDLCDSIVPNRDKPKSFTGDIPWITTPLLNENSILCELKNIKLGLTHEEIEKYKAKLIPKNSVVMTCVGQFGLVFVTSNECVINQQLHAFITNDKINPKYLAYALKSQTEYMIKNSTSTTIPYLNKSKCNSTPVPYCKMEVQIKLVQEIESRFEAAEKLEEAVENGLKQAVALRQSIFKKAFEGKLV